MKQHDSAAREARAYARGFRHGQRDEPDDYVIATGESHSVRELLDEAFGRVDLDWHRHVEFDPRYVRPVEVAELRGDASKAREKLGWRPRTDFRTLVRILVDADLELARREAAAAGA